MKRLALLVALVPALIAVASASALTPTAYRTKANAICAAGIAKINAVPAPQSARAVLPYFQSVATLSAALLRQLGTVEPPNSLKPLVLSAARAQGMVQGALLQAIAKLKAGADPAATVTAYTPILDRLTKTADALWRKAGLTKCV